MAVVGAADADAARARDGEGGTGEDVGIEAWAVRFGVLPVCGEAECEFGGAGGGSWRAPSKGARPSAALAPVPVPMLTVERRAVAWLGTDAEGGTRAFGANGLSDSGGGVGR